MSARVARFAVASALAVSVGLVMLGTWLGVLVRGTPLPDGTETVASPAVLWSMLAFTGVGALVADRRRSNPVGWLLLAIGVLWQVDQAAGPARIYTGFVRPELAGGTATAWLFDVTWIPAVCALPLLVLVFPTGRLPSPRWRVAVAVLAAGAVSISVAVALRPGPLTSTPTVDNPFGVGALEGRTDGLEGIAGLLLAAAFLAALGSLVARYRRGDLIERQQLKWLILAVALVVLASLAADVAQALGTDSATLALIRTGPLVLVPMACGLAVLRYRLFDIDLVISRLLAYGALSAAVVGLYVAAVVGLGRALGSGDEPHPVLAVVTTAAVALAFDPARRGLQHLADRAVYGRRASPYDALASMTRRVGAGYAPDDVLERMARSIAEATGGRGEVWIARGPDLRLAAGWPGAPLTGMGMVRAPVVEPLVIPGRGATFPVRHDGVMLGALAVVKPRGEGVAPAERRLLSDLAGSAAFVLENARLVDELRASRQRLVAAQDDERRRVERDLHDGAQQRLLEMALTLRQAERQLALNGTGDAAGMLAEAGAQLHQALRELRDLARGIHPVILTEQGLPAALESMAQRLAVPVQLDLDVPHRLGAAVESTAYFVVSEALSNVLKHASGATVRVRAAEVGATLEVEVADDGPGGADAGGGGLQGLSDRVDALGGELRVESVTGSGTLVRAVLPCG